jgi:hypothetical protein
VESPKDAAWRLFREADKGSETERRARYDDLITTYQDAPGCASTVFLAMCRRALLSENLTEAKRRLRKAAEAGKKARRNWSITPYFGDAYEKWIEQAPNQAEKAALYGELAGIYENEGHWHLAGLFLMRQIRSTVSDQEKEGIYNRAVSLLAQHPDDDPWLLNDALFGKAELAKTREEKIALYDSIIENAMQAPLTSNTAAQVGSAAYRKLRRFEDDDALVDTFDKVLAYESNGVEYARLAEDLVRKMVHTRRKKALRERIVQRYSTNDSAEMREVLGRIRTE